MFGYQTGQVYMAIITFSFILCIINYFMLFGFSQLINWFKSIFLYFLRCLFFFGFVFFPFGTKFVLYFYRNFLILPKITEYFRKLPNTSKNSEYFPKLPGPPENYQTLPKMFELFLVIFHPCLGVLSVWILHIVLYNDELLGI